jgi:hypothetical protein
LLLNYGSLIIIALFTAYNLLMILRRKDHSAELMRLLAGTVISITASAAFSLVFAQTFPFGLFESIGVCLLFAAAVAAAAGIPFNARSVLRFGLAGWLGALIGASLGTMLFASNKAILITDTIFIIIMYLLQRFSEWKANQEPNQPHQAQKPSKKSSSLSKKKPSNAGTIVLATGVLVAAALILLQQDAIRTAQIGQPLTQNAVYDDQNDLQAATIEVTSAGFSPRNTEFKPGTLIKAVFHVASGAGSGLTVISNDLNVNAPLKPGDNIFLIRDPKPGTYSFALGAGSSKCTFTVK